MTLSDTKKSTIINRNAFSFITGLLTVFVFSCCSPLYVFNLWEDPNCFLTMGRGILKGAIPYRDLYEQKGPLLYFIHALAALISSKTFTGVFLIQVMICAVTHYYSLKIVSVYTEVSARVKILSVPFIMLLYSSNSYFYGDSAEEMILPFYTITFFIILKSIKKEILPNRRETVLTAAGAAASFWIKYSLCGFFLGAVIFFFLYSFRRKQMRELFRLIPVFIITFLVITVPILLYFVVNNAVGDLYTAYFYNNIFLYKNIGESIPITGILPYTLIVMVLKLGDNPYLAVMIVISLVFFILKRNFSELLAYIMLLIFTVIFIFQGSLIGFYYIFALATFTFPALAGIEMVLTRLRIRSIAIFPLSVGLVVLAFIVSFATDNISVKEEDLPQFAFADYMKDYPDATLLNYNFLDQGFYMVSGITPSEKYFCRLNIDKVYDEARMSKEEAVEERRVDFIVTRNETYDWDGYEPVAVFDYTGRDFNSIIGTDRYYLYKKSDI